MKKHEKILKSYRRNHDGTDYVEAEESKIIREKSQVKKLEKQAELLIKQSSHAINDETLEDRYDEIAYRAKKVSGNSNTHKNRLKELKKNSEFK